jgi:hypothetical protein
MITAVTHPVTHSLHCLHNRLFFLLLFLSFLLYSFFFVLPCASREERNRDERWDRGRERSKDREKERDVERDRETQRPRKRGSRRERESATLCTAVPVAVSDEPVTCVCNPAKPQSPVTQNPNLWPARPEGRPDSSKRFPAESVALGYKILKV